MKTGSQGIALVHVYGGCNIDWGQGGAYFYFTQNGAQIVTRNSLGSQIKGYGSAITFVSDQVLQGSANSSITGLALQISPYQANCSSPYVGYSSIPF